MRCPTCDTLMLAEYPTPTVRVWRCLVCARRPEPPCDDIPVAVRGQHWDDDPAVRHSLHEPWGLR